MNVFKLIEDNGLTLHGDIEHFAELIRQEEREACAKVCEAADKSTHPADLADAIRARGNT